MEIATIAVDFDNTDIPLSGEGPHVVSGTRIIWEKSTWESIGLNSLYNIADSKIEIPSNGVYSFDVQMRLKTLVNVERVELALYMLADSAGVDLEEPDYWFVLADKNYSGVYPTIQLSSSTQFDFRGGEKYDLRLILHPTEGMTPSCVLDGSDDYSAWGLSFHSSL